MIIHPYLLMKEALKEADKGFVEGGVPVGALIVDAAGEVIARAHKGGNEFLQYRRTLS